MRCLRDAQQLGWQARVGLPPWASAQVVATVREVLRRAASTAEPLAATRAQHEVLLAIHAGARTCRALTQWSAQAGLPVHYPFLDDRMIEACLAVRLHERTTPFVYKPLTVAAIRDLVPAELLDELILARLGIVDADALRRAASGLYPPRLSYALLEATLAAETWLRAHPTLPLAPARQA